MGARRRSKRAWRVRLCLLVLVPLALVWLAANHPEVFHGR